MRLDCYHHLSGFHYLEEIVATLDEFRVKLDRLTRAQETLMASTARLEAAVATAITLIAALKATQEDPTLQAKLDEVAAALEGAVTPTP